MGFYGGLCEFDIAHYLDVVVPAFRAGETSTLLREEMAWLNTNSQGNALTLEGLADVVAHFSADLSTCDLGSDFTAPAGWNSDSLARLFESVVTRRAVRSFTNLGRLRAVFSRTIWPEERVVGGPQALIYLMDAKPRQWTVEEVGITGWLTADQTVAARSELPEPAFDPASTESNTEAEAHQLFDAQKRFLAVHDRAISNGNGLLWGRDLDLYYWPEKIFADGRAMPLEL